jgi:hypothetical protein|tara:strand:- start:4539 stop:4952 length:414 start_codon:yes stop_codon:yes gene_type:complete
MESWDVSNKRKYILYVNMGSNYLAGILKCWQQNHKDRFVICLRPQYSGHILSIELVHDPLNSERGYPQRLQNSDRISDQTRSQGAGPGIPQTLESRLADPGTDLIAFTSNMLDSQARSTLTCPSDKNRGKDYVYEIA